MGCNYVAITRECLEPESRAGERALLLIRAHRDLYALVGGVPADMKHWMHTDNRHTGGVPAQQMESEQGLIYSCLIRVNPRLNVFLYRERIAVFYGEQFYRADAISEVFSRRSARVLSSTLLNLVCSWSDASCRASAMILITVTSLLLTTLALRGFFLPWI